MIFSFLVFALFSLCFGLSPAPTQSAPSKAPTPNPTPAPTNLAPSKPPTKSPTPAPTQLAPSKAPTPAPTNLAPSKPPTKTPTATPTSEPSSPTTEPTLEPESCTDTCTRIDPFKPVCVVCQDGQFACYTKEVPNCCYYDRYARELMICSFSSVCIKGTCVGWYYFIVAAALILGIIGAMFKYFYQRKQRLAEANRPLIQHVQNSSLPQQQQQQQTNRGYPVQQRTNQGYPVHQTYQTQIQ